MPSPKHYEVLLPAKWSVEASAFRTARPESDWFSNEQWSCSKQPSHRHLPRLLIMFFLGAATTLASQSYGHAAREMIVKLYPQLGWLAPQAADKQSAADRIEQISHSVDRMASDIAASQEQITRNIDHLAADQQQMTREIIRLQAISQYTSYTNYTNHQEPLPQPTSATARKAIHRSSQTR
jgi:hypothetical protein